MKNTVRFNTSFKDGEEGRTISGNSNGSSLNSSSQQLIQGQIFVLHGFDEYQKQRLENDITYQGGIVSPRISARVISIYIHVVFYLIFFLFIYIKKKKFI